MTYPPSNSQQHPFQPIQHDLVPNMPPPPQMTDQRVQYSQIPVRAQSRQFAFTGGAGSYFVIGLLGFLITVLTFGICYPFAVVLTERWRATNTYVDGRQMMFIGSAWTLFGNWIKWFLLCIITIGVYSFWVIPRLERWTWENTTFAQQVY